MNTHNIIKLITITTALLFAGANLAFAGTFQITADGLVITNTNSGAASSNASFGYDNNVFNGNGVNPTNSFAVGNGNSITKWEGPNTMNNLYAFGGSNSISTGGYGNVTNGAAFGVGNSLGAGNGGSTNNTYMSGGSNSIGASDGSPVTDATVIGNGNHIDTGLGGSSLTNGAAVFGNNNIIRNGGHNGIVNALVAGFNNTISGGTNVIMLGSGLSVNSNNSGGIGGSSSVNGEGAYSVGNNNNIKTSATNAFVLGSNITASNANGVILGSNSADGVANAIAAITIGANAPVAVAGVAPAGVVSVGAAGAERQIINVAAGRVAANSTDAVNGSELYATNITLAAVSATVAALASQPAGGGGGGWGAGNFQIATDGTTQSLVGQNQATSIGYDNMFVNSTDSFIYGGTNTVSNASDAAMVGASNTIKNATNAFIYGRNNNIKEYDIAGGAGSSLSVIDTAYTFGSDNTISNADGYNGSTASVKNALAVGFGNNITNDQRMRGGISNSAVFGMGNSILSTTDGGISSFYAFGEKNSLGNDGGWFGAGYAIGTSNTIGGSFNSSLSGAYMFGSDNKILSAGTTSIGAGGNSSLTNAFAIGNNNSVISTGSNGNLASTFAIGVNNNITNASGNYTSANSYAIGSGNNLVATNNVAVIGINNTVSASATNTFILGNYVNATNGNGVILGNNSADGIANAIATVAIGANAPVSVSGAAPAGIVSVGAAGRERQIINVAAGRITANSTDAINGSELYITNTTLAAVSATVAALASNPAVDALLWKNTLNAYDASHGAGAAQRITNVANGAIAPTSLDAVNGSQLYNTAANIATILGTGTVNPDGSITNTTFVTGGTTVNQALTNIYNSSTTLAANALQFNPALNAYDASHGGTARKITNVAAGTLSAASLDAVNGGQLYTTNTTLASLGGTVASLGDTVTNLGNIVNNLGNGSTTINNLVNQIASGSAGIFRHNAATGDITIGSEFSGTLVDISNGASQRKLTGVANGAVNAASREAVNGSQLYDVAANIARILGTGTVNSDGSITDTTFVTGGTTINEAITNLYNNSTALATDALQWNHDLNAYDASHGSGTAQRITNVASGLVAENSLDAINGNQLYTTATSIVNALGSGSVNPDGSITNVQFTFNGGTYSNIGDTITNIDQTVSNIISGSIGLVRQDSATGDITIGAQTSGTLLSIANANGEDRRITGVAAGTADNDAVNIGQLKAAGLVSGTGSETAIASVVTYDSAKKTTITLGGSPSTDGGATGGTRITNLAQAALDAASTDAVNGAQLFATNQRVTNLESTVASINNSISNLPPPNTHFSTGNDDQNIPATATGGNAVAAGMGATASGASSSAVGMGAVASAAQSVAIGSLSNSQATGGVALGNSAIVAATAANSVAIGANSVATEPNTVSFGTPDHERRLVNVANGINPTDAVNMRQFTAFGDAVNDRFSNLQNQVNNVSDRVDNVGAMSAAMNQVQPRLNVSTGNKNQLALGVGGYRGHGAFAMGYGYTCPQGDRGVQASFALSDRGEVMAGAGAIFGW